MVGILMTFRPPEDRWEPWRVDVCMTGGPERIYDRDPNDDTQRRPVGFTPDWTVDPHPWCDTCCCAPDGCRCPEVVTIPPNIAEGMGSE